MQHSERHGRLTTLLQVCNNASLCECARVCVGAQTRNKHAAASCLSMLIPSTCSHPLVAGCAPEVSSSMTAAFFHIPEDAYLRAPGFVPQSGVGEGSH